MLAGVDKDRLNLRMALQLTHEGAIFGRLGRAPTIFRILRRWLWSVRIRVRIAV